jgi:hypothetical protein
MGHGSERRQVPASAVEQVQQSGTLGSRIQHATDWLVRFDLRAQVSPVGTIAAVSTIKMMLFSGARVQCITPFGTTKP